MKSKTELTAMAFRELGKEDQELLAVFLLSMTATTSVYDPRLANLALSETEQNLGKEKFEKAISLFMTFALRPIELEAQMKRETVRRN